jgi:hypothetical protein
MFMCCTKRSSVINLIYSGQQLFSYEANAKCVTHLTLNYIITLLILTQTKLNQIGLAFVSSSLISSSVPWLLLLICTIKIFSIKLILFWTKSLYIIYGFQWIGSYKSPTIYLHIVVAALVFTQILTSFIKNLRLACLINWVIRTFQISIKLFRHSCICLRHLGLHLRHPCIKLGILIFT